MTSNGYMASPSNLPNESWLARGRKHTKYFVSNATFYINSNSSTNTLCFRTIAIISGENGRTVIAMQKLEQLYVDNGMIFAIYRIVAAIFYGFALDGYHLPKHGFLCLRCTLLLLVPSVPFVHYVPLSPMATLYPIFNLYPVLRPPCPSCPLCSPCPLCPPCPLCALYPLCPPYTPYVPLHHMLICPLRPPCAL